MDGETTGSNIEWSTSCVETMVFDFGIQFFCHREITEIHKKIVEIFYWLQQEIWFYKAFRPKQNISMVIYDIE